MGLRRCALLMLGVALSMLCGIGLLFSVQNTPKSATEQLETAEPYIDFTLEIQEVLVSPAEKISLPTAISGTTLVAQRLATYDGPFLEDGSGQEVVNIAALAVYNTGELEALQAGITLQCGDTILCFYGENIPPGATVLLLERNRSRCSQRDFSACSGWQVSAVETRDPAAYLKIEDTAMGTVRVTNITGDVLQSVRLYYKSWLSPPDIYVGGTSREISVPTLRPGESAILYPPCYASGYTKIVSISVNDP